ncbi:TPA: hypothetical protein QB612_002094, partial [Pasteurella multocida]|nr:hypothetical protein [Pasteurella multocida]
IKTQLDAIKKQQLMGSQEAIRRAVWGSRRFVLELDINQDYRVLGYQA